VHNYYGSKDKKSTFAFMADSKTFMANSKSDTGTAELKKAVLALTGPTDHDLSALEGLCTVRYYGKNDYFLRQQVRARFFGFVVSGAFREFYTDKDGREYNKAFNSPGQFTGSYYDIHSGKPSGVAIQALADSQVLLFHVGRYRQFIEGDAFWLWVDHLATVNLLQRKQQKERELLTLSARERYDLLLAQNPRLHDVIADYHIASYLGITPSSFSRINRSGIK
jgi:CRP-like cAMP-binding protein